MSGHPVLRRRMAERAELIARARTWADDLPDALGVRAVVVVGSVARGDFNVWSDLDVLVIADTLPDSGRTRLELLHTAAPPGLQPVGWTPQELMRRRDRSDPMAVEADEVGVVVRGQLP